MARAPFPITSSAECELCSPISRQIFELPMSQEQLADATGLTAVHVNRVLKQLGRLGLIDRQRCDLEEMSAERPLDVMGGPHGRCQAREAAAQLLAQDPDPTRGRGR